MNSVPTPVSPDALLTACPVVPVVVIHDIGETEALLSALCDGGIPAAEITFRTACAADAIKLGTKLFPDMHIGAGTVLNAEQAELAIDCGASFIVSPGLSADVAAVCARREIPYIPGCVTPTEIMAALELGIRTVKFFPANVYGGLSAIKALSGPFPQVKFLPTGGVNLSNMAEFLAHKQIIAIGGSFMMKGDIRANCREIMEVLNHD